MKISIQQARLFLLEYQRLLTPQGLHGRAGILEYIKLVGCIQYDPLNIIGYNPDLVLQARISKYSPRYLQELLYTDRKLIDGWDKNMAIYLTEDWPFFSRFRQEAYRKFFINNSRIRDIIDEIRTTLYSNGPLSSQDLEISHKIDWSWAPTRAARAGLESMFFWGELLVHHRIGTRKYYDFANKYIDARILTAEDPNLDNAKYYRWHVKRRIGSVGLLWNRSSAAWLGIKDLKSAILRQSLEDLVNMGELIRIEIEDIKYPFYVRSEDSGILSKAINGITINPKVSLIAPLDNLLWDRLLIKQIFDFDYIWEVYKPIAERKYGYYVLPVLYGDKFIARVEPRFNKQSNSLEIKGWWWEPNVEITDLLLNEVDIGLRNFANYLGATNISKNDQLFEK